MDHACSMYPALGPEIFMLTGFLPQPHTEKTKIRSLYIEWHLRVYKQSGNFIGYKVEVMNLLTPIYHKSFPKVLNTLIEATI